MTAPRQDGSARRVGVLTFHRCINYGSYWQARQLVEGLTALGYRTELLDHRCRNAGWAEYRCAFQPTLPMRTSPADLYLYGAKARAFEGAIAALPLSARFALHQPETAPAYDIVLIGSDEVWNLSHPWYGGTPIFYGAGVQADRLVSYAASFGNYDAGAGLHASWAERLDGFDAISVRDGNSQRLVRQATGRTPVRVLDPCLLFPPRIPSAAIATKLPYVALYGHSFPSWFAAAVGGWAKRRGIRLLSIGYRNRWADEHCIAAGPAEFAALVAGAVAVVTNFFHGCVFALVNAKPFACVSSDYRSNKISDLVAGLGAERHLVNEHTPIATYDDLLRQPLDRSIGDAIAARRRDSLAYIADALA